MKETRKYWYKFYHHECPVCGRCYDHKERKYGRKPKDVYKRHVHVESYDWCDVF